MANFRFLMKNCKTSKIGIDIFSGAGGLSLGAEWAGITVRYAVELDQNSAKTYARNHPNTQIIKQDISTVNTADFLMRIFLYYLEVHHAKASQFLIEKLVILKMKIMVYLKSFFVLSTALILNGFFLRMSKG